MGGICKSILPNVWTNHYLSFVLSTRGPPHFPSYMMNRLWQNMYNCLISETYLYIGYVCVIITLKLFLAWKMSRGRHLSHVVVAKEPSDGTHLQVWISYNIKILVESCNSVFISLSPSLSLAIYGVAEAGSLDSYSWWPPIRLLFAHPRTRFVFSLTAYFFQL